MMRMKNKTKEIPQTNGSSARSGESDWEVRPGGMLVQKRNPDSDKDSAPARTIRIRVKYGSNYREININSQATFGELKKMLVGSTGLHHEDQKLYFKDKERDSKTFLDIAGVKDKSKIVLVEDPISQEKRYLEMRKNAKMEKAAKSISEVSFEVDRLAGQVSSLESVITSGGNVEEKNVLNLIELLMNQLLKLDGIMGDGEVKLQRKMQVRRVQKYVETLDLLKIKNSVPTSNGNPKPIQVQHRSSNGQRKTTVREQRRLSPIIEEQSRHSTVHQQPQKQQRERQSTSGTVVTTKWETFDSTASTSVPGSANHQVQPRFDWEFFE